MNPEIQSELQNILGSWGWIGLIGFLAMLFRSTLEGLVESFKIFVGRGFDQDMCLFIWIEGEKKAARIVRCGLFKTIFTVYTIGYTKDGQPFIEGGEYFSVQNSRLKDYTMTKPMDSVDLSSWKNGFNGKK